MPLGPQRDGRNLAVLAALGWVLAVVFSLLGWQLAGRCVGSTYGADYVPFELLGGALGALVLGLAALWLRGREVRDAATLAPLAVVVAACLQVVFLVSEYSQASWDWRCYVQAAWAVGAGAEPYQDCYLYPPLLAELLALAHRPWAAFLEAFPLPGVKAWGLVYFTWRALQVPLVAGVALLLLRLGRRWGLGPLEAPAVVAALLLVDSPLIRTLRHDQPNLAVLLLVLVAMEAVVRRPALAGLALALAGHLKALPLALALPWALARRGRALAWTAGFGALLILPVTLFGRHLPWLWEWVAVGRSVAWGEHFRDNGVFAVAINLLRVPLGEAAPDVAALRLVGSVAALVVGALLLWRLWCRQREPAPEDERLTDGMCDAIALTLLATPVVWEHHYLLAVPLLLRAWARHPGRRAQVLAAAALMLALPTFDLFLLSWHRLAGLVLLLWTTRPARAPEPTA
ncbi:MAG: glycosyltransferase 87 family protein [Pseudomonadota bacterium]